MLLFDSPLGNFFGSGFLSNVLKLIVDSPPQSKGRYPDFVGSPLQATLAVPSSGSCFQFLTPISGTYPNYTLLNTLAVNFYGEWPTLPQRCGRSCLCRKANGKKKVESKVEGLVGLGIFFASALSLLNMRGFQIVLQPLPRGALPIFEMILPFHLPILLPMRHRNS